MDREAGWWTTSRNIGLPPLARVMGVGRQHTTTNGSTPYTNQHFLDMSKAFDTLNHEILLRKLAYYGVEGSANKLLQSYLSEQLQYVEFERQILDKLPITTGVPQGSILGPLLFLIYINDLPSISNFFKMIMYADDTTLYCNINKTTTELTHVNVWLKANKLFLNVSKIFFCISYIQ